MPHRIPLVACTLACLLALAGCASHPRPATLRLERVDLVRVGRTLEQLAHPIRREVAAARTVWPQLAHGLPRTVPAATQLAIATADARASALALPSFLTVEDGLTGPAAGISGLLKSYTVLSQRGWQLTATAVRTGARPGRETAASFLHANSGLYIYCVYDGHYDLSLIGKKVQDAYRKLGGPAAFGPALTPAQVQALARSYAIPATRLEPHPPPSVHV